MSQACKPHSATYLEGMHCTQFLWCWAETADRWPQPQSLSKVPRNDVRATPDAAWKAIGVWKQKCSDIKNEHFTIHNTQVIELSCFNKHRHQTSRFLKRLPPKVKFQVSLKGTPSSLLSAPSSPPSLPSPSPSLYMNCLYFVYTLSTFSVSFLLRVS